MFSSVLIANRGEIACRIARTAKRLSIRTIAVYSDADADALHVRLCDEAHWIGPAPARESYLAIDRIIAVAKRAGAACIHPGYGFLSENADFAQACADAGIVFVGPSPDAIRAMGLKDRAKALMEKAGVPVVPGYHGEQQDPNLLKRKAYETGYPVLIKAAAGGGGKGMRRVDRQADFDAALESAMREARSSFGDTRVLIEKYVSAPRHVEIQVLADTHGHVVHLGERDCSLQRRHQKVVEEAPAPGMTPALRERMGTAAVAAAKAVNYVGAGTVEFIAGSANGLHADGFWFMEMNTRLQVEHPITEAITGLDLVEWQFRVAQGERLGFAQGDIALKGHAFEARLYAEDPERSFLPSSGRLVALRFPQSEGLRIDSGVDEGAEISPFYDPMIAKVITHGTTRDEALNRLTLALDATIIAGPRTNLAFLSALCRHPEFRKGGCDTGFIAQHLDALGAVPQVTDWAAAATGVSYLLGETATRAEATDATSSPWEATDSFQLGGERSDALAFIVDGKAVMATIRYGAAGARVSVEGAEPDPAAMITPAEDGVHVLRRGRQTVVRPRDFATASTSSVDGDGLVRAPMHGKVLAVLVEEGESVAKGHRLAVIEAMKMEHALTAPHDGIVVEIAVEVGMQVADGAKILTVTAPPADSETDVNQQAE